MTLARNAVVAGAAVVLATGLWLDPAPPTPWRVLLAVAVAALAPVKPVRYRVGAVVFSMFRGETALIISLCLVPAGWVPFVFAAGAATYNLVAWLSGQAGELRRLPQRAASLTLAAAAGTLATLAVADPYESGLTPLAGLALVLGSVPYLLVTTGTAGLLAAGAGRLPAMTLINEALRRKVPMYAGNVAIGLSSVAIATADWRLLVGMPVAIWLVHQTCAHRIEVLEDRRLWTNLARATRALNQPEAEAVARAGARGAVDVFSVGRAELELGDADAPSRVWVCDRPGGEVRPATEAAPREGGPEPITMPLLVGGDEIGRLRIYFPAESGPSGGDRAALQAYGDALATALKDTLTQHELAQLRVRSVRDAQHDALTGLYNRAALVTRGRSLIGQLAPTDPVALLLLDVNHFREVNDTLGHAAGDEVLSVAAERLRAASHPGDLLVRLGADEFAVLVTSLPMNVSAALPRALQRARQLVEHLAIQAPVRGLPLAIETTVGVALAPAGSADLVEMLRQAHAAMRRARSEGEAVGWFDPTVGTGDTDRLTLLTELRAALNRDDELVLMLHPVVDLRTGAPLEVEALVRWRHPRRGLLAPAEFVRAVEDSELLSSFTEYVLDRALAVAAELKRAGHTLPVAVNLSARSLLDPRLPGAVAALLRKHDLDGRLLVLEITETVVSGELPGVEEALAALRALGVRLAVDDFGTGYASFKLLTRFRLDEVKIDQSFVTTMAESAEAAAIVRTTVEMGRDLGLRVVAEGVESESQLRMLGALGCTAAQGFHFIEPVPAERAADILAGAGSLAPLGPATERPSAPPRPRRPPEAATPR